MPVLLPGTGKKKKKGGGGGGGGRLHWRSTRVRPESVAGGGWFEVLWNLECPVGLSQREIVYYVRISMKEIGRNLDGPPKNKGLWSYVVKLEFSRPKSS